MDKKEQIEENRKMCANWYNEGRADALKEELDYLKWVIEEPKKAEKDFMQQRDKLPNWVKHNISDRINQISSELDRLNAGVKDE